MHILFICTGNTCRSPMAEGYFRYLISKNKNAKMTASSAGTFAGDGELPSPNSVRTMKDIGIDISKYRSSALTHEMLDKADIIIAMTMSHKHFVGQMSAEAVKKTKLLGEYSSGGEDVSDPFGGGADVYSFCFNTMKGSLENLFNAIQ